MTNSSTSEGRTWKKIDLWQKNKIELNAFRYLLYKYKSIGIWLFVWYIYGVYFKDACVLNLLILKKKLY